MSVFYSNMQMEGKSGGIVRLTRPNSLLFLIIALGVTEKWVVEPILAQYQLAPQLSWWQLVLIIAAVVLIAAGGFVINDYFDVKIDAINRPERLIVTRDVTKAEAMQLFQILTGLGVIAGVAAAVTLHSLLLGAIFVLVPGMIWFYSSSYKRMPVVGNLVIAFLAGLVPLVIAFANSAALELHYGPDHFGSLYVSSEIYLWTGGFALFAFLDTWLLQLLKDAQGVEGQRELECLTFPVRFGALSTKLLATLLIAVICGLLTWGILFSGTLQISFSSFTFRYYILLMVAFLCELALVWAAKLPSDYRNAQVLAGFILFLGFLATMCVPKILAQ